MNEEKLYPIVKDYLEAQGYSPVKLTPLIKIRSYRPDVTGIKGKEIQCVEVKPDFNEYSIMAAVTQAGVYMLGTTHTFVAFPFSDWNEREYLQDLIKNLCEENGIGIYLIDRENSKIQKIMDAKFSKYLDLHDYDNTIQQLEGEELIILDNTYPEYIKDLCTYICLKNSMARKDLVKCLETDFKSKYWLYKSGAHRGKENQIIKNRIEKTIDGAVQLELVETTLNTRGEKQEDILQLSFNGKVLAQLDDKIDYDSPRKLDEKTKFFFTVYLLRFPIFRRAIEILQEKKSAMLFGWSKCSCGFKQWDIKKFEIINNDLQCPKCKKRVKVSFLHKLQLEYGISGYYPIIFTKGVHKDPLDIFDFTKIERIDAIKLKQ